jgi:hypothetical protein
MLRSYLKIVFTIFIFIIALTSCKDSHVHEPHDDHYEAEGMAFFQSGNKIAEIFRGVTADTLFASVNVDGALTEIKFYDKAKKLLDPPDFKKNPMSWKITDTSIVSLKQPVGKEGSYEFNLRGKRVGSTDIEFFIMHSGHADFRSGKIPVIVR